MILGVNVDHVATVREARKETEPDPVIAAGLAIRGGADGITFIQAYIEGGPSGGSCQCDPNVAQF